jgi:signal transduction histidine kinase
MKTAVMIRFKDLPIYQKLISLVVLSSTVSLLVMGISIMTYDAFTFTRQSFADLKTQGEIIGANSVAAVTFLDPLTASQYLSSLAAKQSIVAAAIYGADGHIFARYARLGTRQVFPLLPEQGQRIENGDALYFHVMMQDGKQIGTVYLRANLGRNERLLQYAIIVLGAIVIGLVVGVFASLKLQALISIPLQQITKVARTLIHHGDDPSSAYRERVVKLGNDEIGVLADAFNQMLSYMEKRDATLVEINHSLGAEVMERKRTQTQLDEKIQNLAQSNAELEQFAYVSSHDLQEPLRMVASYTQLLERRYRDKFDADGLEFLSYIVDGAKRMQQLIGDLLDLSRIGTQVQPLTVFASEDALTVALTNLSVAIQENAAEIVIDPLPRVLADPSQLTQLFQNLIANAIIYRRDEPPQIHIHAQKKDAQWQFSITDNGIGIAAEHSERIFVIFQRLHGRSEYPGTGIGLAICKKIVERHGGRLWVESQEGKGSTFHFLLAAAP